MTADELYARWHRDWRPDAAQYRTPPESTLEDLTDELEDAVDRVEARLLDVWGPAIYETTETDR